MRSSRAVKAVVVDGADGKPVLLMVRGDHELNLIKTGKLEQVKTPVAFSSVEAIRALFGADPGSLGPVGFKGTVIADRSVSSMADFVVDANQNDDHYTGANFARDSPARIFPAGGWRAGRSARGHWEPSRW